MAGTGIPQLPLTLAQGGWVSIVVLLLVAGMTNYTGRLLIKLLYVDKTAESPSARLEGYPDIGMRAFGKPGRILVHVFHKATLIGVCTLFLILGAKFLQRP